MGERRAAGMLIYRFVEEFQFLMLQASNEKTNWGPPKGHVDPGEDTMTTAIRETTEEAGLKPEEYEIDQDYPPFFLKYTVQNQPKSVEYWLAKLKNPGAPITLSFEHLAFTWMNIDAVQKLPYPDLISAIHNAHSFLQAKKGC